MIRMEDVSYSYGKKEVLHHFNLHVKEGEFLTVIGCSGCGKTTMLKLINALLLPSLGTVYVQGRDITKTDHIALRRSIGYAIQNKGLFPHMTVEDNIAYVLTISGQKNKKQNQKRCLCSYSKPFYRTWKHCQGKHCNNSDFSDDIFCAENGCKKGSYPEPCGCYAVYWRVKGGILWRSYYGYL